MLLQNIQSYMLLKNTTNTHYIHSEDFLHNIILVYGQLHACVMHQKVATCQCIPPGYNFLQRRIHRGILNWWTITSSCSHSTVHELYVYNCMHCKVAEAGHSEVPCMTHTHNKVLNKYMVEWLVCFSGNLLPILLYSVELHCITMVTRYI